MSHKNDEKIMEERAEMYGAVGPQFEAIGRIQMNLTDYCMTVCENNPQPDNLAHLAAMNQVIVKIVRSLGNPHHADNYIDARNYITIAEDIAKELAEE